MMFEAFAVMILQASASVDSAAEVLKIDWSTAHKIMERAVERGLERRVTDHVEHLGIDEKSFGKGAAGERAANLMTIIGSAVCNDLDVHAYLDDVLRRVLAGDTDWASLAPHA